MPQGIFASTAVGEPKGSEIAGGAGLLYHSNFKLSDLLTLPSRESFNGMFLAFNMNFLLTMLLKNNGHPLGMAFTISSSFMTQPVCY